MDLWSRAEAPLRPYGPVSLRSPTPNTVPSSGRWCRMAVAQEEALTKGVLSGCPWGRRTAARRPRRRGTMLMAPAIERAGLSRGLVPGLRAGAQEAPSWPTLRRMAAYCDAAECATYLLIDSVLIAPAAGCMHAVNPARAHSTIYIFISGKKGTFCTLETKNGFIRQLYSTTRENSSDV